MAEQLYRWVVGVGQDDGRANFGMPMRVEESKNGPDGERDGFLVHVIRDGVTLTTIGILFDSEVTQKYEWVGRGADGFPSLEGKVTEIRGKHLQIRKMDDNKVDEELRSVIRSFCQALVSAINKYYAFGSCFSEDAT